GGFGYWKDPQTGETKFKTVNDQLVPVEGEETAEKADKRLPGEGSEPGTIGGGMGEKPARLQGVGATQQPFGPDNPGRNLGTAKPGEEQAEKRMAWDPGPDGDNCLDGGHPPGDVPTDSFVGKTNYYRWSAGPDGTNYTNVSYEGIKTAAETMGMSEAAEDSALRPADKYTQPKLGATVDWGTSARKMVKRMVQPGREPKSGTERDARSALDKMPPKLRDAQVQALIDIKNREPLKGEDPEDAEVDKRLDVQRKGWKLPAIQKDADATTQLNQGIQHLVSDPMFDLDQYDEDDFEDGGAFGKVLIDGDKVIKKGQIGPDEMKALWAMRDNPGFPTLINGRFDGPFKHQSSLYNNAVGVDAYKRPEGVQDYWDPDDKSDFDDMFPAAPGTYAMTRAPGQPLYDAAYDMDEDTKAEMLPKFWKLRAALHEAGFSHNDMHGGNIFVDEDGNPSIIDLGLAKDDPLSALMEALGGASYEQGNDFQLSHEVGGSSIPEDIRERFDENIETIREQIMDSISLDGDDYDDYDPETDYSPTMSGITQTLEDMMNGDIRMRKERLEEIRENLPMLRDRGKVLGLIRDLYKGVRETGLSERMSDAFDKRQKDSRLVKIANELRKKRGEKSISVKGKGVVPPRNLDFDD
ncbi:MAG: hypothetical protein EB165_06335, partial [Euryarchaeota archaeon]|nr:hypothetical protein [Euryarchaeota archaeon]